jgi:hypothetical protein
MASSTSSTDVEPSLPDLSAVRTQATVGGHDAVVVHFANGARLRYVQTEDAVHEEWLPPGADTPARTTERTDTGLAAAALNAVGEYLSFDDRARAAFVWGTENLEVVTDG